MEKQKIVQYLELYNAFTKNQVLYEKGNMKFTPEELNLIKEGNKFVNENESYKEMIKKPLDERIKEVEKMKQELEKENQIESEPEEIKAIKEAFGFDIQNIENKHLQNGVEIFKFYAPKLERVVVLENRQDKSLVELLKNKQAFDEKFQTDDDNQNTDNMLEEERQKDNVELKMIYVSEIDSHLNELSNMKPEDRKKLNYIIKNADQLNVKKINLQNLIYLDQDDNIREVTYDSEKDMIEDQDPNTLNNNVEQVSISDRINESLSHDEQVNNLSNDYEDKPKEIENIEDWKDLSNDIQTQVVTYKEFPDLLDSLDEEERKKWEGYIKLYDEHEREKYRAPELPAKVKVLTPNGHANGTVDVILISIITLITMAAVVLVAIQIYK